MTGYILASEHYIILIAHALQKISSAAQTEVFLQYIVALLPSLHSLKQLQVGNPANTG